MKNNIPSKIHQSKLGSFIVIPILALVFGIFNACCLGKENNSYQGDAFSLFGKTVGDSEFQEYLNHYDSPTEKFKKYGIEISWSVIWDKALTEAVYNVAIQHEVSNCQTDIHVTKKEAEDLIEKYLSTEEELQNFLKSQGFLSKDNLIKTIIKDMERERLFLLKAREFKMEIDPSRVQEEVEQITVSHILVAFKNNNGKILRTDAQALTRAKEIYNKAIAKGDFVKLAQQYSDDPGSKDVGGVYGPMSLGQFKSLMISQFYEAALALKEGGISKPIKTKFGYHIIRLDKWEIPKGDNYLIKYKEAEEKLLIQNLNENAEFTKWLSEVYHKAENQLIIIDPALLAYRLGKEERWVEAIEYYKKALELDYYAKKWNVYLDMANAFLKLKQPANALKILKKVTDNAQNTSEYQNLINELYRAINKMTAQRASA